MSSSEVNQPSISIGLIFEYCQVRYLWVKSSYTALYLSQTQYSWQRLGLDQNIDTPGLYSKSPVGSRGSSEGKLENAAPFIVSMSCRTGTACCGMLRLLYQGEPGTVQYCMQYRTRQGTCQPASTSIYYPMKAQGNFMNIPIALLMGGMILNHTSA